MLKIVLKPLETTGNEIDAPPIILSDAEIKAPRLYIEPLDIESALQKIHPDVVASAHKLIQVFKSPEFFNLRYDEVQSFLEVKKYYNRSLENFKKAVLEDFDAYKAAVIELWQVTHLGEKGLSKIFAEYGRKSCEKTVEGQENSFTRLHSFRDKCLYKLDNVELFNALFYSALITGNNPGLRPESNIVSL